MPDGDCYVQVKVLVRKVRNKAAGTIGRLGLLGTQDLVISICFRSASLNSTPRYLQLV